MGHEFIELQNSNAAIQCYRQAIGMIHIITVPMLLLLLMPYMKVYYKIIKSNFTNSLCIISYTHSFFFFIKQSANCVTKILIFNWTDNLCKITNKFPIF